MIRYPKTWKMLWPGSLWESLLFLLALSSDKIVFKIITRASNADERIFEDMEQHCRDRDSGGLCVGDKYKDVRGIYTKNKYPDRGN